MRNTYFFFFLPARQKITEHYVLNIFNYKRISNIQQQYEYLSYCYFFQSTRILYRMSLIVSFENYKKICNTPRTCVVYKTNYIIYVYYANTQVYTMFV